MDAIGRRRWAIAEGYIPRESTGPAPELTSHETVCVLNASGEDARVAIHVYYADREPVTYRLAVPARRTRHVRFNDLRDPEPIPVATDFASVIEASVPVVVQHTRLDSRQPANALLSTIAWAEGEDAPAPGGVSAAARAAPRRPRRSPRTRSRRRRG